MVKQVQSKKVDSGDVAKTREQINIPDCLMNTYSDERFLLDDSGSDDEERVLIFETKNNIDLLETNPEWYCDGTFAVSASLFYQVLTINVIVNGKNLPVIYDLLPNKTEETYLKIFNMLNHSLQTT
ncbi:unnamed protein product [Brachionus calyciflorus]|uniref:Uncharacterized protein n=1 Tax=Brachionus calyciflorus TaxID=104777 RepID=A0A814JQQ5_9BILA|nr:unnamed protein product [Brachionus calyciflorus]